MFIAPIDLAFLFINFTNSSVDFPIKEAIATAESLPDLNIKPYSISFKVIISPSLKYMLEPSTPTDSFSIVILSSSLPFSNATKAVIILVVLAIGILLCAFLSYNTLPVLPSISIYDSPLKSSSSPYTILEHNNIIIKKTTINLFLFITYLHN